MTFNDPVRQALLLHFSDVETEAPRSHHIISRWGGQDLNPVGPKTRTFSRRPLGPSLMDRLCRLLASLGMESSFPSAHSHRQSVL